MFKRIEEACAKPIVWSTYTADVLWTDSHIAKQMLAFHLNPDLNLASRTAEFIDASVDWLVSEFNLNAESKAIDFGCGPGLYTQRLKSKGVGTVVGLDFSQNSLEYAKEQAKESKLDIEYHYGNYLEYSDVRKFDLITLVMCDLCALNPDQRATLLGMFKSLLGPNGSIALDVYTTTRFAAQTDSRNLEKNAMGGFWSAEDYWCLQSSFKYEPEMVTLDKYVIFEDTREWIVYNWLQHFDLEMLASELEPLGLEIKAKYGDLKGSPFADGDEMALVISHK
ncbi:methyltransferase domain-containing protein [Agarivorans sp. B2Z047]|uniref:class I SAM-dependent methyltransferase n=1 Tax=Agarivorans sp. B2Z047 TaxID=2652721 RepID=UPI00128E41EA|nr:class I SAM-dependent methyltransferase [Agarivorans sp. B2Z047]MPW29307.1 methyltransferase domain-containing protein [Agarivorans sp. B2Z047]UQN44894.1 class I SAM-dependent methyltransferase [Agarivorans sp. B2Z047]